MVAITRSHVSVLSRERAHDNIRRKINLIDQWISGGAIPWKETDDGKLQRDEEGELLVEWFPRTIVEFARWTGSENSLPVRQAIADVGGFDSFGRSTLDRARELKASVLRVLGHIRLLADRQIESFSRGSVIESLNFKLGIEQARTAEALQQYVGSLATNEQLRRELELEKRLRAADIERLTDELNAVRADNARLTVHLRESESLYLAGGSNA